jgi:hypothetical protein
MGECIAGWCLRPTRWGGWRMRCTFKDGGSEKGGEEDGENDGEASWPGC